MSDSEQIADQFGQVLDKLDRLDARITRLQRTAREAPRKERIDLDSLVRALIESARQRSDAEAKLAAELKAMPPGRRLKVVTST